MSIEILKKRKSRYCWLFNFFFHFRSKRDSLNAPQLIIGSERRQEYIYFFEISKYL